MYLKSINNNIIFEGKALSIKQEVENAVEQGVCLNNVNLRGVDLSKANLDYAQMSGACLWGANLSGTNMSHGNFDNVDFRTANLSHSCLAYSDCHKSDFRGSYFSNTIVEQTDLSDALFSCPSIFSIDLIRAKALEGALYNHMGEKMCDLSNAPLIIRGLDKQIVFMNDSTIIGADLYRKTSNRFIKKILKNKSIRL